MGYFVGLDLATINEKPWKAELFPTKLVHYERLFSNI